MSDCGAGNQPKQAEILIDLSRCTLTLRAGGNRLKVYPVAVGNSKTPSPVGRFRIIHKARWGGGFGTRWMGLDVPWGTYGIHGTNKPGLIGQRVSHGCIRMHNRDVEAVFELVEAGTPVTIQGTVNYQALVLGSRGALVQRVQGKLQEMGYYEGICNGIFDSETEAALSLFQKEKGLPVKGQAHYSDLRALGVEVEQS